MPEGYSADPLGAWTSALHNLLQIPKSTSNPSPKAPYTTATCAIRYLVFSKHTVLFYISVQWTLASALKMTFSTLKCGSVLFIFNSNTFLKDFIYLFIFRERKEGRKRGRATSMCECFLRSPLGTWPATQACALTGNQTCDPLVGRPALNPPARAQIHFSVFEKLSSISP